MFPINFFCVSNINISASKAFILESLFIDLYCSLVVCNNLLVITFIFSLYYQ